MLNLSDLSSGIEVLGQSRKIIDLNSNYDAMYSQLKLKKYKDMTRKRNLIRVGEDIVQYCCG